MSRSRPACPPAMVQALEARRLLSADLSPRGLLLIPGTDGADTITVDFSADDALITVAGATEEPVSFPARRVRAVIVRAGAGDDVVTIGELPHRTLVGLGEGDDALSSSARFTHGSGGAGNDSLTVLHELPSTDGGAGDRGHGDRESRQDEHRRSHRRFTAFGAVLLAGGEGDDTLVGSVRARFNNLLGGAGNDNLSVPENARGRANMLGGDGDDELVGGLGPDRLFGTGGNDSLFGRAGNDLLSGGDGNDELLGEDGDDTLLGGPGQDTLNGGAGDNVLRDPDA